MTKKPAASDTRRNRQPVLTPADIRHVLATEIERVAANPDLEPSRRAHSLAELTRVALRAMELETLDARVEAIESTLKFRKDARAQEETL
jgi:hypothetical protein